MSRLGWRRVVVGLKAQADKAKVKAKAEMTTLPPFFEVVVGQPLSAVRQALKVTDPLALMDQEEWARVIVSPAPPVPYYGLDPRSFSLDLVPFLTFAFGIPPGEDFAEHEAVEAQFLAELASRPDWLRENAATLRAWLLWREYEEAGHEDNHYWRPLSEIFASMFRFAEEADAPERLSWWVENLTGLASGHSPMEGDLVAGVRIAPQEARAWLEAYITRIGPETRCH